MRPGGPTFQKFEDPGGWVSAVKDAGYGEAFCPVGPDTDDDTIAAYVKAAEEADIVIAETRPGLGNLDYATYLRELSKLDPDTTLMLEHLSDEAEYRLAADHIRKVATEEGIDLA